MHVLAYLFSLAYYVILPFSLVPLAQLSKVKTLREPLALLQHVYANLWPLRMSQLRRGPIAALQLAAGQLHRPQLQLVRIVLLLAPMNALFVGFLRVIDVHVGFFRAIDVHVPVLPQLQPVRTALLSASMNALFVRFSVLSMYISLYWLHSYQRFNTGCCWGDRT
jgi:hypothetical protein